MFGITQFKYFYKENIQVQFYFLHFFQTFLVKSVKKQNWPIFFQGLAVDPIEDVVYWTDQGQQTINYLKLNDTDPKPQVLLNFNNSDVQPRGITIDVCGR